MTDELTDAVKRIKELQADVERLKAGQDREGVPRLLFSQEETAIASDQTDTKPRDIAGLETAIVSDQTDSPVANDISVTETSVITDVQAGLRPQRTVETGAYNNTGYNTSTVN